ncbi:hypothetical protein GYB61_03650 [bacterium]|nr:hypothetical protein [bacterium]
MPSKPPRTKNQRNPDKLDLRLSFSVRYGDDADEQVVFMDDREMKLVGSLFQYRDRIMGYLSRSLVKVAMLQPKIAASAAQAARRRRKPKPSKDQS